MPVRLRHGLFLCVSCAAAASLAQEAARMRAPLRLELTPKDLSAILSARDRPSRKPVEPPPPAGAQCKTVPAIAALAAVAVASSAGAASTLDASNLRWMFKSPEDRTIADFLVVRPSPGERPGTGSAAEESTLHP